MDERADKILKENEKMKTMRRSIMELKDLTEKCNEYMKEDVAYINTLVDKGDRDVLGIQKIIRKIQEVKKDTFTFTLLVTVGILGALLFFGLLFG